MAIKILVVDDSAVMRKMIKRTIKLSGVEVAQFYEAANGKEGLKVLEKNRMDILFVDINMPVMDGMEMLKRVRKQDSLKELPIFVVSTESNEGRVEKIDCPGVRFVHKPFTPEDLREKMLDVIKVS